MHVTWQSEQFPPTPNRLNQGLTQQLYSSKPLATFAAQYRPLSDPLNNINQYPIGCFSRVIEDISLTTLAGPHFYGIHYLPLRGNTATAHILEIHYGNSQSSHTLAIATRACNTHNKGCHTRFTPDFSDRGPSSCYRRLQSVPHGRATDT